jgi:hypothetical protein
MAHSLMRRVNFPSKGGKYDVLLERDMKPSRADQKQGNDCHVTRAQGPTDLGATSWTHRSSFEATRYGFLVSYENIMSPLCEPVISHIGSQYSSFFSFFLFFFPPLTRGSGVLDLKS